MLRRGTLAVTALALLALAPSAAAYDPQAELRNQQKPDERFKHEYSSPEYTYESHAGKGLRNWLELIDLIVKDSALGRLRGRPAHVRLGRELAPNF